MWALTAPDVSSCSPGRPPGGRGRSLRPEAARSQREPADHVVHTPMAKGSGAVQGKHFEHLSSGPVARGSEAAPPLGRAAQAPTSRRPCREGDGLAAWQSLADGRAAVGGVPAAGVGGEGLRLVQPSPPSWGPPSLGPRAGVPARRPQRSEQRVQPLSSHGTRAGHGTSAAPQKHRLYAVPIRPKCRCGWIRSLWSAMVVVAVVTISLSRLTPEGRESSAPGYAVRGPRPAGDTAPQEGAGPGGWAPARGRCVINHAGAPTTWAQGGWGASLLASVSGYQEGGTPAPRRQRLLHSQPPDLGAPALGRSRVAPLRQLWGCRRGTH